jgi:plastocyanin
MFRALVLSLVLGSAVHAGGSLSGKVSLPAGAKMTQCVVYLEGDGLKATPSSKAKVAQAGKKFVPEVLTVVAGSSVDFPNEDKIFHNVFSLGPGIEFDLGQYRGGQSKSQAFATPGPVDLYCNIHPDMFATVLVVPNDFHTTPKADGTYTIENVPAGSYTAVGWVQLGSTVRNPVTIKDGEKATADIALSGKLRPKQHTRKDGSDYGRYK